ncbi:CpaF family protein [Pseudonocardia oroxyli]|uniref:Pilus assembly protein, ATPase of CpaF family n=1 Tax=Pseudonocardia oroxyli TaxID=366584 RepID=A0A1G8CGQ7_PSEOR|nr:CpaF/VirB11 family protein [Pseudonocardia oroxyli]SDH44393.1 Pilus assembly protein, ATPase of CpaF family [Pseudonocardia oroxyli]
MTAEKAVVDAIRGRVIAKLAERSARSGMTAEDERQELRALIEEELETEARARLGRGHPVLAREDEAEVLLAVERGIWGLGQLQALLDLPDVEDIYLVGSEPPMVRLSSGEIRVARDAVATSDAELIQQIQHIAAHHGTSERAFTPAQPCLNMQLPDGSRLAAVRDVVPRPTVTIRKHRLLDFTLDDLVAMGTLSAESARFIRALIVAKQNILVTGEPTCGKTTLLRAIAREIPPHERIATLETEFELRLHLLHNASPLIVAMEARPGSTEFSGRGGERAGEMTLSALLHQTLRLSVTRVIIGEVRGEEALAMLEAMNAGMPGSMCTLHAGSSAEALERLATAALKGAGSGWSDRFVTRLVAQGIDYVIHMRQLDHPSLGGRRRFVSEISEVTDVNEVGRIAVNRIFAPDLGSEDPRPRLQMPPQKRRAFEEAGVDLGFLNRSNRNGAVRS